MKVKEAAGLVAKDGADEIETLLFWALAGAFAGSLTFIPGAALFGASIGLMLRGIWLLLPHKKAG